MLTQRSFLLLLLITCVMFTFLYFTEHSSALLNINYSLENDNKTLQTYQEKSLQQISRKKSANVQSGDPLTIKSPADQTDTHDATPDRQLTLMTSILPQDARWQTVVQNHSYVYSAHLDQRENVTKIVIIGTIRRNVLLDKNYKWYCQIWENSTMIGTSQMKLFHIDKFKSLLFPSVDMKCPVPSSIKLPDKFAVSVSTDPKALPHHLLLVTNRKHTDHLVRNFTVCLWSPAFSLQNPLNVIEWFEINTLLGAEKFLVYNYSITCPQVNNVLWSYQLKGLLDIYQWNLEPGSVAQPKCHYNLQMAMIGDCQYRTMYNTRYVVGLDLDEFIVPRVSQVNDWADVMTSSGCEGDIGYYSMRHVIFDTMDSSKDNPNCVLTNVCSSCQCNEYLHPTDCHGYLRSLCRIKRINRTFPVQTRSKYIARPVLMDRMKVHGGNTNFKMCVVNTTMAALHHYRENIEGIAGNHSAIPDTTMVRFGQIAASRILAECNHMVNSVSRNGQNNLNFVP